MLSEAQRVRFYCKLGEKLGVEEAVTLVTLCLDPETKFEVRGDLQVMEAEFERQLADVNLKAIQRHEIVERKLAESESRIKRRLDELEGRFAEVQRERR